MKKLNKTHFFFIGFFIFLLQGIYAQDSKHKKELDTLECLEITGTFDGTVKDFGGVYTAKLIRDNKVIETEVLKVKKKFDFILKKNLLYAIRVEKEGYISKTISISTKIPPGIEVRRLYEFTIETNLLSKDLEGHFDDDDVDFPVALISYNKKCDCFLLMKSIRLLWLSV